MQNRSSKLFYEDDHSQPSEYTITSLNDDSIGWNSDGRFASSQENSFTTNSMFEFQTKRVKTNQRNGQDKNQGEDRPRLKFGDSKINAIDMLEQFKCTVKSRGTFTSPFGAPPKVSVTKVYDTTFADAIDQKSKKDKAKRSTRKGKELEPPISSSREPSKSPEKEDSRTDTLINVSSENLDEVNYEEFGDKPPEWALKENAVDKKGNRPGDPEYNPSTLKIPRGALDSYTPLMKQYWEIKSNHYDEILLFKVGDFYRVCYDDAVICHKELNLNWLGNKMIVGVHEKNFDHDVEVLVNLGYKVSVAEQTETAKLKKKRVKSQREMGEKGSGEKIIQRQIAQVMSKGTFIDYNNPNYEPRYLLALRTRRTEVAIVLLEIGYSVITVGYFNDNESFLKLKTLITQIRPTEVVYDKTNANEYIINYLRYSHNAPVLSPIVVAKFWNSISVNEELEKYYGDRHDKWPEVLQGILQMETSRKDLIMMDFAIMINYLQQTLIVDQVLQTARYESYDPESLKKTKMILDAQALQHLEILEVSYSTKNSYEGSLLSYIDNTTTKYGKRLLKKWICAPLVDVEAINNRLDAIEELDEKSEVRDDLRSGLKRLHDFQRVCGKIYSLSIKRPENLILFEDVSLQRLREFKNILESFQTARDLIADVQDLQWKSTLLKDLLTLHDHRAILNNESTLMPDITPLLEELSSFIVWGGSNKDVPAPKPGVDKEYDRIVNEIEWINRQFAQHLEEVRSQFDGNKLICYTHTKCRYEIEIPVELVQGSKKPADFEISSKRKGFERFITPRVSELVPKLDEAEDKLKEVLKLFVCFVFRYFYNYNKVWDAFINGLAQIDCLCSLSVTSFSTDERMCRPQISEQAERPYLEVKSMKHPCVSVYKPNFVPNDIVLGDPDNTKNDRNIIMITGPNMGGKSTILRQACIAAILAQIGCYIPAESCRMTVVDRVFTRIGASDRLIEGKSTFSIEMEEVLSVLRDGTRNSLAIMDELGRGTTTFDGIAIAYAVLKHLSEKLKCRTLFATHYHILLDEFRFNRNIAFYYMDYHIDNKHEKIEFRYRLTEGECSKSFGLNIAKVAGIESQVVERARAKAEEFDREFNLRDNIKVSKLFSNVIGVLINKGLDFEDSGNTLQMLENTIK